MADVFVSYSRRDLTFTKRLCVALTERGMGVWVDVEDLPPASRWDDELKDAIRAAHAFVFVISADSVSSRECIKELDYAASLNKRIVPVHLSDSQLGPLPEPLATHNWIPQVGMFTDDFERSLDALVRGIETDLDWVHQHTEWGQKAAEWEEHGRDRSFLISGTELDAAEQWLVGQAGKQPTPTTLQSTFVLTSRRDSTRRLRRTRAVVSVALVIAVALTAFALVQRGVAVANQQLAAADLKTAQAGELAAEARAVLPSDPELSTMLALRAQQVGYTSQGDAVLRAALPAFQVLHTLRVDTPLQDAVFSPDGKELLVAAASGPAQIWDAVTAHHLATLSANYVPFTQLYATSGYRYGIAFSPDSARVVTAYGPKGSGATVWDAASGRVITTLALAGTDPPVTLSFSRDGAKLVGASQSPTVVVWNSKSGQPVVTINAPADVQSARFSPDGTEVVTTDLTDTIVWNARTGAQVTTIGSGEQPYDASFSPDGTKIVTIAGGSAEIWDVGTATLAQTMAEPGAAEVTSASFSPDGSRLVTSSIDDTARIWDVATGAQTVLLSGHTLDVQSAVFSPTGNEVATASSDGSVRIWDAWPREMVKTFAPSGDTPLAISPDGGMVIAQNPTSSATAVWDVASGAKLFDLPPASASFSGDGRTIASEDDLGSSTIWDVATHKQVAHLSDAAPDPDIPAMLSPDGTRVLTDTQGGVEIWNVASGARLGGLIANTFAGGAGIGAAFSPDGDRVVLMYASGTAIVYDTVSGRATVTLVTKGPSLNSVAFSPDGGRIITGGDDGSARIWDVSTGKEVSALHAPGHVLSADYSADGKEIVTAVKGIGTTVWQTSNGRQLFVLNDPNVAFALMTRDGQRVASLSDVGPATIWSAELVGSPPAMVKIASGRVTRGFTPSESRQYLSGIA